MPDGLTSLARAISRCAASPSAGYRGWRASEWPSAGCVGSAPDHEHPDRSRVDTTNASQALSAAPEIPQPGTGRSARL